MEMTEEDGEVDDETYDNVEATCWRDSVTTRIRWAWAKFRELVPKSKAPFLKMKDQANIACIRTMKLMFYGCYTRAKRDHDSKMEGAEMKMIMWMSDVS